MLSSVAAGTLSRREMTITINLSPEQERRLAERAARAGQEVTAYVHQLIDHDIQAESLDAILAPVRRGFEQSGMTDDDLAALVEEVREVIWREEHDRPSKAS
jgi:predicted DNA-binding protein